MSEPNVWFFIVTAFMLVAGGVLLMIRITPSDQEDKKRWAYMKGEGPDPYPQRHKHNDKV